jgi:hypothetical protein
VKQLLNPTVRGRERAEHGPLTGGMQPIEISMKLLIVYQP